MNRKMRRAAARRGERVITSARSTGVCPDCDADERLVEMAPRLYRLEIRHDDTCPWLRARRQGATA